MLPADHKNELSSSEAASDVDLGSTCSTVATTSIPSERRRGGCTVLPCYLWPLLVGIDGVHAASMDAWLPNIFRVQRDFGISAPTVGLTLQLNMLASAASSTFVGALADRLGRRRAVALAFFVYMIGGILAAVSQNIAMLLVARVVMGLAQGSQTLAQVIARDLVDDAGDRLKVMSTMWCMTPLVNVSGPLVGGALGGALGWRSVCWLQAVWGAAVMLGVLAVSETKVQEPSSTPSSSAPSTVGATRSMASSTVAALRSVATTAGRLVSSRLYVGAIGLYCLMFASISMMLTMLPFVLEGYYHLSPAATGGLMGAVSISIILGSSLSFLFSKHAGPLSILCWAMLPVFVMSMVDAVPAVWPRIMAGMGIPHGSWWPILVPSVLLVTTHGCFAPICQALYLNPFKDIAGAAAGVAGLTQTLMMAGGSALATAVWQYAPAPRTFFGMLAGCMLAAQLWFWLLLGLCPPAGAREAGAPPTSDVSKVLEESGRARDPQGVV